MMKLKMKTVLRLIRFWPPYLGAGVKVVRFSPDLTMIEAEMKLHFWNKNYVGTQFGGSMYSMTEVFLMAILLEHLGRDHIIWDKSAIIHYKSPGRGTVHAKFHISKEEIEEIRRRAAQEEKVEPHFKIQVLDDSDKVVAEVERILYVRRKNKKY